MLLFWVTLHVLLHHGDSLVPVVTVQLGKPVIFTCSFIKEFQSMDWIHWYKQNAGDNLKLISMARQNTKPIYGQGFSSTNYTTTLNDKMSSLTILKTATEDEGMYHCGHISWFQSTWNGTYLLLKGNIESASGSHVVQQPAVLDPSGPADSENLECSLLSQPERNTCSVEPSVFWFRAGSDKPLLELIYTDGNMSKECEETSNAQKKCSYNLSKKVTPFDVGTYYCAVATCGEILLGDGTKVEISHSFSSEVMLLVITVICLAISLIVNIVLICCQTRRKSCQKCRESSSSQAQPNDMSQLEDDTDDGEHQNYAALHFSTGMTKMRELKTEESTYSNIREFI